MERYGKVDIEWGEVHRLVCDEVNLPANGGSGSLGIFRVTGYAEMQDGRYRAVSGDSYKAVVEFSQPIHAEALLSYGNASQSGSPHRSDQLEMFSKKQFRPVWRDKADIERNLELREIVYYEK